MFLSAFPLLLYECCCSVAKLCLTLCDPMCCGMPAFPFPHYLLQGTQDRRVMVQSSDKTWSAGEGNGKPLQYFCLENPMNSMKWLYECRK